MFAAQQGLPGAYQASLAPGQTQADVGSKFEDLATRQKNDELRLFDATQNAPWDQLSKYNAIVSGQGQLGGNTTKATTTPGAGPSQWMGTALQALPYLF